jgi:hypothetical protein
MQVVNTLLHVIHNANREMLAYTRLCGFPSLDRMTLKTADFGVTPRY